MVAYTMYQCSLSASRAPNWHCGTSSSCAPVRVPSPPASRHRPSCISLTRESNHLLFVLEGKCCNTAEPSLGTVTLASTNPFSSLNTKPAAQEKSPEAFTARRPGVGPIVDTQSSTRPRGSIRASPVLHTNALTKTKPNESEHRTADPYTRGWSCCTLPGACSSGASCCCLSARA